MSIVSSDGATERTFWPDAGKNLMVARLFLTYSPLQATTL